MSNISANNPHKSDYDYFKEQLKATRKGFRQIAGDFANKPSTNNYSRMGTYMAALQESHNKMIECYDKIVTWEKNNK